MEHRGLNIKFSLMHLSPRFLRSSIHAKSTITTIAAAFWKNGSFAEPVPLKSAVHANQKASKLLAFCSGDR